MKVDADRADGFIIANQPGRVRLERISWYHDNRGTQGVLPMHAHDIALDISKNGTSRRRYGTVRLIEVPEKFSEGWLKENRKKAASNPLLANFAAMSHRGPYYAALGCTHFVEGQKLCKEGGRRYLEQVNGERLALKDNDTEG